ncbi:hypothetical protein [Kitasatospora sp. NPDC057223]|uniref:hypothetical protein n=1 Tax=Kitasatospora sp. NPDC057223 TaxID=3346055 RepID=UPI00363D45F2
MTPIITDRFERDLQRRREDRVAAPLFTGGRTVLARAVRRLLRWAVRDRAPAQAAGVRSGRQRRTLTSGRGG